MNRSKIFRLVAFIVALVKTILTGFFLIPLIWRIPLTIKLFKSFKENKPLPMGYNVCTYVFLSRIAGLLHFIDGAFEAHQNKKLLVYLAWVFTYVNAVNRVLQIIPCFWLFASAYTLERLYNENVTVKLPTKIAMFFFAPLVSAILLIFVKKNDGKVIKYAQIDNYNPVLLFRESKAVQKLSGFKMFFVKNNLLKGLNALGGLLKKAGLGIAHFFQDLVLTFVKGSWKTRISYYIMGFGSFARGQWLRGLLFLSFQIIFIFYMIFFGGKYLVKLGSLGDYWNSYTTADGTVMWYDNSFNIMLYGVLTLFFIAAFVVTWYFNIRQNKVNDQIEEDVRIIEHTYIEAPDKRENNIFMMLAKIFLGINVFFGYFAIVPAFIGAMLYRELENGRNSKLERIMYGVISFLFVAKIPAVFMILDAIFNKGEWLPNVKKMGIIKALAYNFMEVSILRGAFLIAPAIIGGLAMKKTDDRYAKKTTKLIFAILTAAFVNLLAGGLLILNYFLHASDEVYVKEVKASRHVPTAGDDLRAMVDKNFHTTLLAIPTVGILLFTVLPIFFMILVAFTNYDGNHDPMAGKLFGWVGFENFGKLLTWTGGNGSQFAMTFGQILLWTLVWAFFATFTNYFIGMLIAMLINKKGIKLKKLWRTILVFSIAVPQFISLMFVSNMFSDSGIFNTLYLNIMTNIFHLSEVQPIPFWTDPWLARITVVIINIWIGVPYLMLVVTGILMNIPADLYESANIDGANPAQQYMKITLPYMLFITGPYLLTSFTGNMNNFNVIYLLTGGGPTSQALSDGEGHYAGSTDLLITWLFSLASTDSNYKLASVIGIMVFIVVSVLSLVVYNLIPSTRNEEEFQ